MAALKVVNMAIIMAIITAASGEDVIKKQHYIFDAIGTGSRLNISFQI